jgi:hypothetical protein
MSNQVQRSELKYGDTDYVFGMSGQPTVSVNVLGTISVGDYTPQVSNDNQTWYDISVYNAAGDEVTAVTVAGLYRADVNGYELFRLHPSTDFDGDDVSLQYFAYPTPMISQLSEAPVNNDLLAAAWQAGTYDANEVVMHGGKFWVADTSTTDEPGPATDWTSYDSIGEILTVILNLFNAS